MLPSLPREITEVPEILEELRSRAFEEKSLEFLEEVCFTVRIK